MLSGPATISGSTVTITGAGTVTLQASQGPIADYNPASATTSFTVSPAALAVTAGSVSQPYGAAIPTFTYAVTGFVNGDSASVVSGTATLTTTATSTSAPGSYPISFSTEGLTASNYSFNYVSGTLTIHQASQTITFGAIGSTQPVGEQLAISAKASSGLAVSFTSLTPSICTVSGFIVTLKNTGTCTIQASQAGNTNYAAAAPVSQSFTVVARQ